MIVCESTRDGEGGKIGKRGIEWEIHRVAFVFPDPMGVCLKSVA